MDEWRRKLQQFMIGRYGTDQLNHFLNVCMVVLLAVNLFVRTGILYSLAVVLLIISYYRMLSRNISARFQENERYMRYRFRVTECLKKWRFRADQARKFHIYKCPGCGQKIRIPRGKGKISIHCPKCHTDFIKRS
ncbi:MAG: hypothetical protein Q4F76_09560 [Lachnospiraceae bacterium]|nr:hypothetical protein [Lachnospiraceae bacterium]